MRTMFLAAGLACAASFAGQAVAANFYESEDLPYYGSFGPAVYSNTAAFDSGLKLDGSNLVANPSGWNDYFTVTLDTTAHTITLTSSGYNSFQTASLDITNIAGMTITGLWAGDTQDLIAGVQGTMNPVDLSFTGNSLHIGYSVADPTGSADYFLYGGQTSSVFNYSAVAAGVPEPASWALMLGGFGMVGGAIRSRRKAAVSFG